MRVLFQNAVILTVDQSDTVFEHGALCVEDDTIRFVGKQEDVPASFQPDRIIDAKGSILMPGFVNAHCHSPMTMFRNYTSGLPLKQWMYERNRPLQQFVTREDIEACANLAYAEMIKSGTTCFAEMYMWGEALCELTCRSGLRAVVDGPYQPQPDTPLEAQLQRYESYGKQLEQASRGRVREGVGLHSVYGASDEQIAFAAEFARTSGCTLQVHLSETREEGRQIAERFHGATALQVLERAGALEHHVLAAHCIYLTEADLEILKSRPVYPVHCPSSNLYLGSGIADVPGLLKAGIPVCLGTDGAGSNNTLNMVQELHIAALLHKGVHTDAAVVSAREAIRMATINGAKALGLEHICGSLEVGKRADLIMLRTDRLHMTPLVNAYNAAAYCAQGSDVTFVMVDGRILMENDILTHMDEEALCRAAAEASARVLSHGTMLS